MIGKLKPLTGGALLAGLQIVVAAIGSRVKPQIPKYDNHDTALLVEYAASKAIYDAARNRHLNARTAVLHRWERDIPKDKTPKHILYADDIATLAVQVNA